MMGRRRVRYNDECFSLLTSLLPKYRTQRWEVSNRRYPSARSSWSRVFSIFISVFFPVIVHGEQGSVRGYHPRPFPGACRYLTNSRRLREVTAVAPRTRMAMIRQINNDRPSCSSHLSTTQLKKLLERDL